MSKKKTAPGTEPEGKEVKLPTGEPKVEPPKTLKAKVVPLNIYDPLITYLKSKSMIEVEGLVRELSQLPIMDFTITNATEGN